MSDLISRADAIRVISEEYHNRGGNFDGLDAIRELETLPSKGGDAEMLNEDFRPKYMQQCPNNGADLISRADAIAYIDRVIKSGLGRYKSLNYIRKYISALPSADAVSRKAKCCPIAETCMSIDCPVSSEYIGRPSADAESDDLIIKGAKGIKDGLYNIKDGKLFKYKANGGTVRTYPIVRSADAVPQLRQTDTLIIADALRYLAKDTERHLVDRTRADALRQQFLKYGASMCKGGVE